MTQYHFVLQKSSKSRMRILITMLMSVVMTVALITSSVFAESDTSLENTFKDVTSSDYFFNAAIWAVENGVTNGTSSTTFSPNEGCTRAQAVTFLWREEGEPSAPEEVAVTINFSDVDDNAYYSKAVKWAVCKGITKGVEKNKFAPDEICTRAQIVTFMNRMRNDYCTSKESLYSDVFADQYYAGAVKWAACRGITKGVDTDKFAPDITCTRGQIVTFLHRLSMIGSVITFGNYEQDNDPENGREAIEWKILALRDGKALLCSEKCLDAKPYNEENEEVTWENCSLRQWLNDIFYSTAFSNSDKSRIRQTTVVNENISNSNADGNDTVDRVFVLSQSEVKDYFHEYGPDCQGVLTAYAEAQGAEGISYGGFIDGIYDFDHYDPDLYKAGWWWLRSSAEKLLGTLDNGSYFARAVNYDGYISSVGRIINQTYVSVRPALWIEYDF